LSPPPPSRPSSPTPAVYHGPIRSSAKRSTAHGLIWMFSFVHSESMWKGHICFRVRKISTCCTSNGSHSNDPTVVLDTAM
jgi:hypothetical protein